MLFIFYTSIFLIKMNRLLTDLHLDQSVVFVPKEISYFLNYKIQKVHEIYTHFFLNNKQYKKFKETRKNRIK